MRKVDLAEKPASFDEAFAPKIVGYSNGDKQRPRADEQAEILLVEPIGPRDAGDADTAAAETEL